VARTPSSWFRIYSSSTASTLFGGIFDLELIEARPGFLAFQATGKTAREDFRGEAGGHRFQRVPPTEKRGRVQTSTVTVAVLPVPTEAEVRVEARDLKWSIARGSGAGGQHRNVTASAVQVVHVPTGIMAKSESERSQHQNKRTALALLRARLLEAEEKKSSSSRNRTRKSQVGSGMRGDKIRTVALQRNQVTDHRTGKRMPANLYMQGRIDKLL